MSKFSLADESLDQCGDFVCGGVQGEVAAIDDVDFGFGDITAVGLWLGGIERRLIPTPDHQQARLLLAHPCLPFRVGIDVGAVVVEEIALNLSLAGLINKIKFVGPEIGVMAFYVGIVPPRGGPSWLQATGDLCAARFRWERDRSSKATHDRSRLSIRCDLHLLH